MRIEIVHILQNQFYLLLDAAKAQKDRVDDAERAQMQQIGALNSIAYKLKAIMDTLAEEGADLEAKLPDYIQKIIDETKQEEP